MLSAVGTYLDLPTLEKGNLSDMKKYSILIATLLALTAVTACQKKDQTVPVPAAAPAAAPAAEAPKAADAPAAPLTEEKK